MKRLINFDQTLINHVRPYALPLAKWSLFLVFSWFGLLKVLMISPAADLVVTLQNQTLPWVENTTFLITFGLIEMIIGFAFVIPNLARVAILLLVLHMITTFLPLIFLPEIAWQSPLVPTLEGQYIIKNLVLIALALQIGIHLKPLKN